MTNIFSLASSNFLSPAVLSFFLGVIAGGTKSDLHIPEQIAKAISLYLMFAIGFNGGVGLRSYDIGSEIILALGVAMCLSFFVPFLANGILGKMCRHLNINTRAAIAAHYGSISIVTFATAMQFLKVQEIGYEKYIVAMAALMETPAIVAGIYLIKKGNSRSIDDQSSKRLLHEVFFNGSIMLLLGGFIIGFISDIAGVNAVAPFFSKPIKAILCFFLLDMGILVARRFVGFKKLGWSLVLFGFYMPLIGGVIGAVTGNLIGLSIGGTALLATLVASASYIAVPAAMRIAVPEVNPSIYISMSLGITFPFNIIIGIPTYLIISQYLGG